MADHTEIELLHAHRDVSTLYGYGDVTITVWHASGDEPAVLAMEPAAARRLVKYPRGVSGVQLITHGAGMPTAGARNALAEQARKFSAGTVAVAVVIEQAGFFGSAMRSAVTGIQMLAKAAFPIKVFRSVQEVAAWLPGPHAERTGTVLDPARLENVLQTVRDPLFSANARPGSIEPAK